MLISKLGGHPPAGSTIQKSNLNQVWLDDLFNRIFLFMNGGRQSAYPNRAAFKLLDDCQEQLSIHLIEAVRIDLHSIQRIIRDLMSNPAVIVNIGIVAHPA